jgi:hypothetical protein
MSIAKLREVIDVPLQSIEEAISKLIYEPKN